MAPTEATTGNLARLRLPAALTSRLDGPLLAPVRAFRVAYLPLLTVYLASGALGIVAVADSFWVKKSLTLTPAELASLAVWLQLPWTAKMLFSEFVNSLPILGSQRRSYTFIGAGLIASAPRRIGRRGRRLDRVRKAGTPLRPGAAPRRHRQRHPGGRGRRHEPRRLSPHRRRRHPAPTGGDCPRPRHGRGAGAPNLLDRRLRRRLARRPARQVLLLRNRIPDGPRGARAVGQRRAAGATPASRRRAVDWRISAAASCSLPPRRSWVSPPSASPRRSYSCCR